MAGIKGTARKAGRQAQHSDAFELMIRVGLVAHGVVHLLIGALALQVAFGEKSENASSTGAFQTVAQQPFGVVLLWVLALGLLALVAWRLIEAWDAFRSEDGTDRVTGVVGDAGKAVIYLVLAVSAITTATGSGGGGGGTTSMTATLMSAPGGQLLVGAVGLGVLGYGGYYVYKGWSDKFLEKLDSGPKRAETSKAYRILGKVGHIAKGVAIGVVGALFVYAAATHDPKKSAGLDQALSEIASQPFGQVLLTGIALGIIAYGLFCFAEARHFKR